MERYSSAVESKSRKDYLEMTRHWFEGGPEPEVFREAQNWIGAPGFRIRGSASYASAVYSGVFCLLAIRNAREHMSMAAALGDRERLISIAAHELRNPLCSVRFCLQALERNAGGLAPQATRMRITARSTSLLYDTATAVELVQQTEKILDAAVTAKLAPAVPAAAGASRLSAN